MSTADSYTLVQESDPTLVYLIFTWIRSRYANHPAGDAVLGRLLAISDRHPSVAAMMKEGEADSVVTWFEETHTYRDLSAKEFVALIVDKLES